MGDIIDLYERLKELEERVGELESQSETDDEIEDVELEDKTNPL